MAQMALAWSMAQDAVTAPIVGTTSLDNLLDLLGQIFERTCARHDTDICMSLDAINITLTPEEKKYLEEPYRPKNVIGHN